MARQFIDGEVEDLSTFTSIEATAAESQANHEGEELFLDGLTKLSKAVVESLAKRHGKGLIFGRKLKVQSAR